MNEETLREIREVAEYDKPHWRIMYDLKTRETRVVCLQSFDYRDYQDCGFVNDIRYESEQEAEGDRNASHYYGPESPDEQGK